MQLSVRRFLNHLASPHGSTVEVYIRPTWHKPTPYDHCKSQAPFRPLNTLRADHFGRSLRWRRIGSTAFKWVLAGGLGWVLVESVRAITVL